MHDLARLRVERGERLVHQQHLRPDRERPGYTKKVFNIPLSRPRDYEMRVTPQFNDLKLAIWQTLKDEITV